MHVGVNSRIYQNKNSGVPYHVYLMHSKILELDKQNTYTFFQTRTNKTIGNTRTRSFPDTLWGAVLFDSWGINKLIKQSHVDVVHGASVLLPINKVPGVKYVTTVYDVAFLHYPQLYSAMYLWYHKNSIARTLRMADAVVCISESTKRDVMRFFGTPEGKIQVIYPGINDIFWQPAAPQDKVTRPYFFSVTTHPSRKNIFSVLEAMATSEPLKRYTYVIAGLMSKEHAADLKEVAHKLGILDRVQLLGFVEEKELQALYRDAAFCIYPSFYEGFGLPVIEAMASRCLALTSNNSSLPEVNPNKEWTFTASDIAAIRDTMERAVALSDIQKQEIIEKNFVFSQQFTWENAARSLVKVFESVAGVRKE